MNRRELVLAVLACADGRTFSPVQIQKATFLLSRNMPNLIEGPGFAFKPYDYGPFDSDVYSEIESLGRDGLAVTAPSGIGRWSTYAASDAGVARGQELLAKLDQPSRDYVAQISTWVRRLSFGTLVKSIYEAYPDMKVNSIFKG